MPRVITPSLLNRGGPALASALNDQPFLLHPWQNVYYVQSTHRNATNLRNQGTSPIAPLGSIAQAVANCAAGDVIVVGPGHVEVVATAAGLDINKAGLTIIGIGNGALRPMIQVGGNITTPGTTAAFAQISGAGVRMSNFQLVPNLDAVTKMLNISGANVQLDGWRIDESSAIQSVTAITVAVGASGGAIRNLVAEQFTAGATQCILISGACVEFSIVDCVIRGNYSTGNISVTAAALHLDIGRNILHNLNTNVCIICGAVAASGMIYLNMCSITGATAAPFAAAITLGSAIWTLYENYAADGAGLTGALIGTAAS